MTEPVLAWEQRKAQTAIEYGTYRAKYPIIFDGQIAYQPGSAVPISNVKRYGYDTDGLVERVDGQPLDAPLPDGAAPIVEQQPAGEGWVDGGDQSEPSPELPHGDPIELGAAASAAAAGNAELATVTDAVIAAVPAPAPDTGAEQPAPAEAPAAPEAPVDPQA